MKWEACIDDDDDEIVEVIAELYESVWPIQIVFTQLFSLYFFIVILKWIVIGHVESLHIIYAFFKIKMLISW